ncbi:MAG TPA: M20/M25/M40 family metallo-hydrolase, partial [Longimicrobiales bacterium]
GTGELAIAQFARDWLRQHAVNAWLDEVEAGRCNVVAEVGRGAGPTLVACAHLDTVQTAGMEIDPFEPVVEGSRVYGRGSYDMKGGVAAILCAAAALSKTDLAGRFLVALVVDEEYASIGARHFVTRYRADACVVTEPTTNGMKELVTAHKGFVWLEVVTRGRAAHGSRWDVGASAITRMAPILAALDEFDRTALRQRQHPLVGPASMHCALIRGGSGISTYAPDCTLTIERRTIPGETPEQVLEEIRSIVGDDGQVTVTFAQPPLDVSPQSRIAQCARAALEKVTGTKPAIAGVAYWMDAALFADAGMDTVNFGAVGDGAHAAVEWVDLDSVVQNAQALYETGGLFCS